MKREFSAGGVVFNSRGQVLLVRNYKPDKNVDYWGFPKGHLEEGEGSKEAALREVEEETGVKAEIGEKVDTVKYFFVWDGQKTYKTVTFFLMGHKSGEVRHQASELAGAAWFDPEQALKKITFKDEKELFQKALELKNGRHF